MKKNIKNIMTSAHEIARKITAQHPGDCYAVNLAAALRLCWQEAGKSAAEIWSTYTAEDQYDALLQMARYEFNHDDARHIIRDGQIIPSAPLFAWVSKDHTADDLRAVAHEAFIRLYDVFDRRPEWPLSRALSRAICAAAQAINRQERRNARAIRNTTTDDGETLDAVDLAAGPRAERIAPGPEEAAIIRDSIRRAARDDKDRAIMGYLATGHSAREIADRLEMSHTAINKRIAAIRDRYAA